MVRAPRVPIPPSTRREPSSSAVADGAGDVSVPATQEAFHASSTVDVKSPSRVTSGRPHHPTRQWSHFELECFFVGTISCLGGVSLDMRKALLADTEKRSVIPLTRPVTADELEFS